ncbi:hypothetical protein C8R46DRAFT_1035881 [Mycena filopes]|nr:hypothetical protein C8R46DRAFT_1035881 [Mycena filopes]
MLDTALPSPVYLPQSSAVNDFFGGAGERMNDCPLSNSGSDIGTSRSPATLAMYLYKFGFLFPPFWIMGILILFSPLRAPTEEAGAWLPEKTEAERQCIIQRIRVEELKWARKCLYALLLLILGTLAVVIGAVAWHATALPRVTVKTTYTQ